MRVMALRATVKNLAILWLTVYFFWLWLNTEFRNQHLFFFSNG